MIANLLEEAIIFFENYGKIEWYLLKYNFYYFIYYEFYSKYTEKKT